MLVFLVKIYPMKILMAVMQAYSGYLYRNVNNVSQTAAIVYG
jgi:hypothetical protein